MIIMSASLWIRLHHIPDRWRNSRDEIATPNSFLVLHDRTSLFAFRVALKVDTGLNSQSKVILIIGKWSMTSYWTNTILFFYGCVRPSWPTNYFSWLNLQVYTYCDSWPDLNKIFILKPSFVPLPILLAPTPKLVENVSNPILYT